ncbi:heparan-alpha-glucosaminide N-acetyltransferase domain-containing protein [Arenivirga flava]|uniref:Heparan-alpha-glucosaminide N-acetyltransferase catalytic domain-containing protein n=1 Tax=Arenivirga flava TaxID=1930060 RepID=A0AA37X839_9MICO|nr:heparan-alpha-glucosaminide N-acetyltransferase domain-containing protein [Arenivirga flava]GMA27119.1 hypothetical protein GCM10025874_03720 [Arenivirga flava]
MTAVARVRGSASRLRASRIIGVDVARGLAVLGMLASHMLITTPFDWAEPGTWTEVVDGRSSILFAVLAGVSLAILSGGRRPHDQLGRARMRIAVRAMAIFALGSVLTSLGTPIAVILEYYAVLFLLALPVLRARPSTLFIAAGVWMLVMPWVRQSLWSGLLGSGADQLPFLDLLITGYYPALVWFGYTLLGLGIGRLALGERRVQLLLLAVGAALAAVGYTAGALAGSLLERDPAIAGSLQSLFAEPFELLSAGPHSDSTFEAIGSSGFALAVLALCLLATGPLRVMLAPVAATGALALTAYTAHIVVLWVLGVEFWLVHRGPGQYLAYAVPIVAFCTLWWLLLGKGPLERPLTWISNRVADLGRVPTQRPAEPRS